MSRLADVSRLLEARPGADFVAGAEAAQRLAREAADARRLVPPIDGDTPDVVARIDGTPLRIRCRIPSGTVYVVRPENVPSPTDDDWQQAKKVAKIVQLL